MNWQNIFYATVLAALLVSTATFFIQQSTDQREFRIIVKESQFESTRVKDILDKIEPLTIDR